MLVAAYADLGFQSRLVDFKGLVVVALVLVDDSHVLSSLGHVRVVVVTIDAGLDIERFRVLFQRLLVLALAVVNNPDAGVGLGHI